MEIRTLLIWLLLVGLCATYVLMWRLFTLLSEAHAMLFELLDGRARVVQQELARDREGRGLDPGVRVQ